MSGDFVATGSEMIRATRSVLLLRLGLALASGALAFVGRKLDLGALPWLLLAFAVIGLLGVAWNAFAVVRVDDDGIRFRRFLVTRRLKWAEIFGIDVTETFSGTHVSVDAGGSKRRILPVPRSARLITDPAFDADADMLRRMWADKNKRIRTPTSPHRSRRRPLLIVMAVALLVTSLPDRPWGWFDTDTVSTLPHPCVRLDADISAKLGAQDPIERPIPVEFAGESATAADGCAWQIDDGQLLVSYLAFTRNGLHSGADMAVLAEGVMSRQVAGALNRMEPNPDGVPGTVYADPIARTWSGVSTKDNVLVVVSMIGAGSADRFAVAVGIARSAV
jgi:hypothetical protein